MADSGTWPTGTGLLPQTSSAHFLPACSRGRGSDRGLAQTQQPEGTREARLQQGRWGLSSPTLISASGKSVHCRLEGLEAADGREP